MREESQYFFIKNIYTSLFFRKGLKSLWCVRQMDKGSDRIRQIAIMTYNFFSLDHPTPCSLQDSTYHFFCFSAGGTQLEATESRCSQRGALRDCKLTLTQASTDSNRLQLTSRHLHILFHNAYNFRCIMWLLPLIYTDASLIA